MAKLTPPTQQSQLGSQSSLGAEDRSRAQVLPQDAFLRMLYIEQKRTERSRTPFVLMLVESETPWTALAGKTFNRVLMALSQSTRETDISGWYSQDSAIGVIFTEIGSVDGRAVAETLLSKITKALSSSLAAEEIKGLHLSFHVYPEEQNNAGRGSDRDKSVLFPEFVRNNSAKKAIKRSMDIVGSLCALILASPVLVVVAVAVKLTSKGPVLFRQERVGQYGRNFTFLKFRSMHTGNDSRIHEEYVKQLIVRAKDSGGNPDEAPGVYKITSDPRVTSVGKFLRRTSLDEVPQFLNVLLGEMSLVGPRPPIPYEVECYDLWHRRRLLSVKPGITGLWQVMGRSRVSFDDMVRMDLRYATSWTPWLDLKILLQTPHAVISTTGAF